MNTSVSAKIVRITYAKIAVPIQNKTMIATISRRFISGGRGGIPNKMHLSQNNYRSGSAASAPGKEITKVIRRQRLCLIR